MSYQRKVIEDHIKITDKDLDVDYYENFTDSSDYKSLVELGNSYKKLSKSSRTSLIFGESNIKYEVEYKGKIKIDETIDWREVPLIKDLGDKIAKITNTKYTVCIFQWYPTGKVGIGSHRDKEMKPGTKIAGVSYGTSRNIKFINYNVSGSLQIKLDPGSLYVMNHPTNDKWLHSIMTSDAIEPRISLTYRDY